MKNVRGMREPSYDIIQKEELLRTCFEYLSKTGLESVSMRNMCDETGIVMSSMYYWFGNKDGVILSATEWGINHVVEELFEYMYKYIDNLQITIITFSEVAMQYKKQLRFIYQVVTSLKYGEEMRDLSDKLFNVCEVYAEKIASHFDVNKQDVLPCVHLFLSAVLEYVIWYNKPKLEMELSCVYNSLTEKIKS